MSTQTVTVKHTQGNRLHSDAGIQEQRPRGLGPHAPTFPEVTSPAQGSWLCSLGSVLLGWNPALCYIGQGRAGPGRAEPQMVHVSASVQEGAP